MEWSDNYSETSGILWQYYGVEPTLNTAGGITDFPDDSKSALFRFNQIITGQTGNKGTKYVEIIVPLKYLCNFWRTVVCEMSY